MEGISTVIAALLQPTTENGGFIGKIVKTVQGNIIVLVSKWILPVRKRIFPRWKKSLLMREFVFSARNFLLPMRSSSYPHEHNKFLRRENIFAHEQNVFPDAENNLAGMRDLPGHQSGRAKYAQISKAHQMPDGLHCRVMSAGWG